MNVRIVWLGWLTVSAMWLATAVVRADEPPAPVVVEETAEPIQPAESDEDRQATDDEGAGAERSRVGQATTETAPETETSP